ncbi:hypothetical protein KFU94_03575 [Chloroflexi bacterium TSY]|nr:hypothetical protein [Chloroflexi bacterium TSY]
MTPKSLQSRLKIAKNAKFGSTDTRYLRFTLLTRGLAPFELGGLQMVQQLITIEASLLRAQEKGGIRY